MYGIQYVCGCVCMLFVVCVCVCGGVNIAQCSEVGTAFGEPVLRAGCGVLRGVDRVFRVY